MAKKSAGGKSHSSDTRKREAYWRRVMAKQRKSGLNHTEFCERESLSRNLYYWWKRELGLRGGKGRKAQSSKGSRLVGVTIRPGTTAAEDGSFEVLLANSRVVRVPAGFDSDALKRLLSILEERPC